MAYNKLLPAIRELLELAHNASFPVTRQELVRLSRETGSSKEVTGFLKVFRPDEVFKSRVDFLTRAEELELLLSQERAMPAERLRSPQG